MAVDLIRTRTELRAVVLFAAAGSCVLAIGQIVVFTVAFAHHSILIDDAPAFLNTSANSVALYLEPPLAFAAGFALYPSDRRDRWLGVAVVVLILAAIVLTLSRASYLALAVLAIFLLISVPERRWRLRVIGALALVALAVVELPFINVRIGTFAHSAQLRTSIYGQALRMLSERPILGAGISGFPIRVAPFRPLSQAVQLYPHDIWLTTWSEIGLLGLISFAVIFFGLLWHGRRALAQSSGLHRAVIWGATGALVLYLVHGLFDSPYWKNDLSVEFWLLAALMIVAVREARKSAGGSGSS
jgi:O-antigen ligase